MKTVLKFKSILGNENLVSESVLSAYNLLTGEPKPEVAEIDPKFMGGMELANEYGLEPSSGANCIIIEATKGEEKNFVALVIPVGERADLNGFVRKYLGVKRISLAPLDKVLEETKMEYGSITPFGLPDSWKILVDTSLMKREKIIVGGGKQISKLLLPTAIFKQMVNVELVDNLSKTTL